MGLTASASDVVRNCDPATRWARVIVVVDSAVYGIAGVSLRHMGDLAGLMISANNTNIDSVKNFCTNRLLSDTVNIYLRPYNI
jgi:hypothetical protein